MITAVLQARMSSSRLPGKVLKLLAGKPMLVRQVERVLGAKKINRLVIATSTDPTDDPIESIYSTHFGRMDAVSLFRGCLDDVLDRYYQVSQRYLSEHIVRLTGDCPLADPAIIDAVIAEHLESKADYTSNCHPPSLPDGLDVEVLTQQTLTTIWENAERPSEREHVTAYIRHYPDAFDCANYHYSPRTPYTIDPASIRLTVDHEEDFCLIEKIVTALYPQNPQFSIEDVLQVLKDNPQWSRLNAHIPRNEGAQAALQKDREAGFFR